MGSPSPHRHKRKVPVSTPAGQGKPVQLIPARSMTKAFTAFKLASLFALFLLASANGLMQVDTVATLVGVEDLNYTHGVRASVFAIISASAFFASMIQYSSVPPAEDIDALLRGVSVVTAFFAGVFWLLAETQGNTGAYVYALFAVAGVLGGVLAIGILLHVLGDWIGRRRSRPGPGSDQDLS